MDKYDVRENLRGNIKTVTPSGRFGVVELDTPVKGLKYAVINDESDGRIGLMNKTGKLEVGTRVNIHKALIRPGSEALAILEIALVMQDSEDDLRVQEAIRSGGNKSIAILQKMFFKKFGWWPHFLNSTQVRS